MSDWTNSIHTGDCFDVLGELPAESVHAVVTDPPYAEGDYDGFMGRDWDSFDGPRAFQEWNREWATAAKQALKPGGHLLAFGSDDGHHRTACGIEDAGFEIRTHINWIYGSGFPKALDVSKAIDKRADAEREVVGAKRAGIARKGRSNDEVFHDTISEDEKHIPVTAPATDAAEKWDGWKTALKPATEFVVLARKPLSEGTVAENVQMHGTGALNIDGCRVEQSGERPTRDPSDANSGGMNKYGEYEADTSRKGEPTTEGRYPSNVVFDEQAAERLDRGVGSLSSGSRPAGEYTSGDGMVYGEFDSVEREPLEPSEGGPSRYFYTSKATKAERTLGGRIANAHPTVKPQDLMEWLVRLVTREGQTVLDPFAGSGTTCAAAKDLGREFIGIERQAKWADVARVRVGLTPEDASRVRDDDAQQGLEAFTDGGGSDE